MSEKAIAVRSKECIVSTFFQLLEKDSFSSITISEIAAHAGLDRRTFYRHFKTKEDILAYYIKSTAAEYEAALKVHREHDNRAIAEAFFTVCRNQSNQLRLLIKQNLSHLLLHEISKAFVTYQEIYAGREELEHPDRDYRLAYHIGGFWNIMNCWLMKESRESPREMAEIIGRQTENTQI